jgi:hypothetical protein
MKQEELLLVKLDEGVLSRLLDAYAAFVRLYSAADATHPRPYLSWADAGGGDQCAHGVAKVFACQRCDELIAQAACEAYWA